MYNSIHCYATCSTNSDRMRSLFCVGVIQGGAGIYTHGGGMRGVCKSHEYLDPPPPPPLRHPHPSPWLQQID